jgi:hypothetical protein
MKITIWAHIWWLAWGFMLAPRARLERATYCLGGHFTI